jgi:hypothetical protein
MWAFIFASIFFAILRPWGSFPWESLQAQVTPFEGGTMFIRSGHSLCLWFLIGTLVPYVLVFIQSGTLVALAQALWE